MKSNVCRIENGTNDLAAILKEGERVAAYNRLTEKQALQLRLLLEELDGMLPNIIGDFGGEIWIEFENGVCKINAALNISSFSPDKKEELINTATDRKNAAAHGIVGKIRSVLEDIFLDGNAFKAYSPTAVGLQIAAGCCESVNYSYFWTLEEYKNGAEKEKGEEYDELERSIIASVADNVTVGVTGRKAEIVILKDFSVATEEK